MPEKLDSVIVLQNKAKVVKNPQILVGSRCKMVKYVEPEAEERDILHMALGGKLTPDTETIERKAGAITLHANYCSLSWGMKRNGRSVDRWAADQLRIPTEEDAAEIRRCHEEFIKANRAFMAAKSKGFCNGTRVTLKVARELFETWDEVEKKEVSEDA